MSKLDFLSQVFYHFSDSITLQDFSLTFIFVTTNPITNKNEKNVDFLALRGRMKSWSVCKCLVRGLTIDPIHYGEDYRVDI